MVAKEKENTISCWKLPEESKITKSHFFVEQEKTLLLDGQTKAVALNELNAEGFVTTFTGSIWFIDWEMMATLKINSFHDNTASL